MSIRVECPACETAFAVPEKFAGRHGKCPKCGAVMAVPDAAPADLLAAQGSRAPAAGSTAPATGTSRRRRMQIRRRSKRKIEVATGASDDQVQRYRSKYGSRLNVPVWVWFLLFGVAMAGIVAFAYYNYRLRIGPPHRQQPTANRAETTGGRPDGGDEPSGVSVDQSVFKDAFNDQPAEPADDESSTPSATP